MENNFNTESTLNSILFYYTHIQTRVYRYFRPKDPIVDYIFWFLFAFPTFAKHIL